MRGKDKGLRRIHSKAELVCPLGTAWLMDVLLAFRLQVSCGSCQTCAKPEPIPGISAIFQAVALTDTLVSVWVYSDQEIAGVQFRAACKRKTDRRTGRETKSRIHMVELQTCTWGGDYRYTGAGMLSSIDVESAFGGEIAENGFAFSSGIQGKWLAFSFEGAVLPTGYYHLTTLKVLNLVENHCDEGSFVLRSGVAADITVREGTKDKEMYVYHSYATGLDSNLFILFPLLLLCSRVIQWSFAEQSKRY